MKKILFAFAVAAALTGCIKSEVLDVVENGVIGFDTHIDKATKITTVETGTLTDFWMYCAFGTGTGASFSDGGKSLYFDGVNIKKSGDTYTYDHKVWIGNSTFRFATYSDGNAALEASKVKFVQGNASDTWGLQFDDYTAGDKDLIAAIPAQVVTGEDLSSMPRVTVGFEHMLSRVQFVFYVGSLNSGHKLRISELKVNAVKTCDASIMLTEGDLSETITWDTVNGTSGTYVFANEGTEFSTVQTYDLYVIPQNNQNLEIESLTVQTISANNTILDTKTYENISLALSAPHTSWEPGIVYGYTTTLSGNTNEIHFSATVNSWSDPASAEKGILQ